MLQTRGLSLSAKGLLVVMVPVAALLVAMGVFYEFARSSAGAEQVVVRTYETRGELRSLLTAILNAETGIRGYLLTRRPEFLAPYEAARHDLPRIEENTRALVAANPELSARLRAVDSLAADLLSDLERSRSLMAAGNFQGAVASMDGGKDGMDRLRAELAAMMQRNRALLVERQAEAHRAQRRMTAAIFAGAALGLLGGILAALLFATRIAGRVRRLEDEAREVAAGRPIAHAVKGHDEIARLERVLQETAALLAERAAELKKAHDELEFRVEQRTGELRAANEELRSANDFRDALIRSAPLAIWAVDLTGNVTFWSPTAERIFGWTAAEVIGGPPPVLRDEDREEYGVWIERFARGESLAGMERKRRRKDGSEIDVVIWSAPLRDAAGGIRGTIAIDSDLSERNLLEEQFRQAQKMEAMGRLAGGVAHDFNNLLTVIQGYSEMAATEGSPEIAEYALEIQYAANRASALTAQLLAFSRRQVSQPQTLDLNDVVAHSMKLLQRVIGEDIEVITNLAPNLPRVKADPIHIDQVIMNLVVNARDAMGEGGRLTIETATRDLDAEYAGRHIGVSPGRYAMLAISDTGSGMTAETRERIFEPFFTTKEAGKGTGLGLSIVYGVVKQNHGEIMVYSEPGRGTTFRIYLPEAGATAPEAGEAEESKGETGTETVLLCEDEDQIRDLVKRMLTRQGYRVLAASSAEEALQVAREERGEIDLLLTDIVLPHMSGLELAREMARVRPGARTLYMTGYADSAAVGELRSDGDAPLLQKPFTSASLATTVRKILDGGDGA